MIQMNGNTQGRINAVVTTTDSIDIVDTDDILAVGPWIMQLLEVSSIQQSPIGRAPVAAEIYAFSLALTSFSSCFMSICNPLGYERPESLYIQKSGPAWCPLFAHFCAVLPRDLGFPPTVSPCCTVCSHQYECID